MPRSAERDRRPFTSTSTCRCPTGATARCASRSPAGDGQRLFVTTDRLSAFDRIIAGVPVQGPGAQPARRLVVRPHRRPRRQPRRRVPDPNVLVARAAAAAAGRGRRARLHHRRHVDVALADVRRRRSARSTATTSPTACGRTRAARGDRHPDHQAPAGRRHDEPLTCAEVVERGLVDAGLGSGSWRSRSSCSAAARSRRPTPGLILADTKYEFGLAADGDAAADRRGAHARLVALLGGSHLR